MEYKEICERIEKIKKLLEEGYLITACDMIKKLALQLNCFGEIKVKEDKEGGLLCR